MTRKIVKQVLLLTCMFFAITVTAQKKQKIYVWNFVSESKYTNEFINDLTEDFQTELIKTNDFTVLQRREFANLLEQNYNERAIQALNDLPSSSKVQLASIQAELVVFGKISQNADGRYKLIVQIQDLSTSEIKNTFTDNYQLYDLIDGEKKSALIYDFVCNLLSNGNCKSKISENTKKPNISEINQNTNVPIYKLGDSYGGGIIFYIDNTGQHGLIAAVQDLGIYSWFEAKQRCLQMGNGWYMPSIYELQTLYTNRQKVGNFVNIPNISQYWSSSEDSVNGNNYGFYLGFYDGVKYHGGKDSKLRVRPIRAF